MILKSFYRKKTTKIYFIIFVLIMCALAAIIIGKDKYVEEYNKNYEFSFIYVESSKSLDLSSIDHVIKVEDAIHGIDFESKEESIHGLFYYMPSEKVKNRQETIIPSFFEKSYLPNSSIEEGEYSFVVKDYYDMPYLRPIVYINENVFKEMSSKKNKKGYILKIDSWLEQEQVIKNIMKTTGAEAWGFELSKSNINYSQLIEKYTMYSYIIMVVFVLVSFVTIYNIINDHKDKKYLYRSLGYTKKKICLLNIVNISSLYMFAFIISLVLVLGIYMVI